jgi:hypothetical protein
LDSDIRRIVGRLLRQHFASLGRPARASAGRAPHAPHDAQREADPPQRKQDHEYEGQRDWREHAD